VKTRLRARRNRSASIGRLPRLDRPLSTGSFQASARSVSAWGSHDGPRWDEDAFGARLPDADPAAQGLGNVRERSPVLTTVWGTTTRRSLNEMGNSRRLGRESSSTAPVAALQCLPPVQRAALLLSDISGFPTAEIAEILGSTEESVEGALELARETLSALRTVPADSTPPPNSSAERVITSAFTEAFESGNVGRIEDLLSDDAALELRPSLTAYQGCSEVSRFLSSDLLYGHRNYRLTAGRVDLRPTFACYVLEPYSALWRADGAIALTLRGSQIKSLTRYTNNGDVARFGFPLATIAP
jgi:hypothetical protein